MDTNGLMIITLFFFGALFIGLGAILFKKSKSHKITPDQFKPGVKYEYRTLADDDKTEEK